MHTFSSRSSQSDREDGCPKKYHRGCEDRGAGKAFK